MSDYNNDKLRDGKVKNVTMQYRRETLKTNLDNIPTSLLLKRVPPGGQIHSPSQSYYHMFTVDCCKLYYCKYLIFDSPLRYTGCSECDYQDEGGSAHAEIPSPSPGKITLET